MIDHVRVETRGQFYGGYNESSEADLNGCQHGNQPCQFHSTEPEQSKWYPFSISGPHPSLALKAGHGRRIHAGECFDNVASGGNPDERNQRARHD